MAGAATSDGGDGHPWPPHQLCCNPWPGASTTGMHDLCSAAIKQNNKNSPSYVRGSCPSGVMGITVPSSGRIKPHSDCTPGREP